LKSIIAFSPIADELALNVEASAAVPRETRGLLGNLRKASRTGSPVD
jgi:hypothetical protein